MDEADEESRCKALASSKMRVPEISEFRVCHNRGNFNRHDRSAGRARVKESAGLRRSHTKYLSHSLYGHNYWAFYYTVHSTVSPYQYCVIVKDETRQRLELQFCISLTYTVMNIL